MMGEAARSKRRQKAPPTWPEIIITTTWQTILLITIGVALVSLMSGVSLMATALRVALALVSLGLLGWLINWVLVAALANARAQSAQPVEASLHPAAEATEAQPMDAGNGSGHT